MYFLNIYKYEPFSYNTEYSYHPSSIIKAANDNTMNAQRVSINLVKDSLGNKYTVPYVPMSYGGRHCIQTPCDVEVNKSPYKNAFACWYCNYVPMGLLDKYF